MKWAQGDSIDFTVSYQHLAFNVNPGVAQISITVIESLSDGYLLEWSSSTALLLTTAVRPLMDDLNDRDETTLLTSGAHIVRYKVDRAGALIEILNLDELQATAARVQVEMELLLRELDDSALAISRLMFEVVDGRSVATALMTKPVALYHRLYGTEATNPAVVRPGLIEFEYGNALPAQVTSGLARSDNLNRCIAVEATSTLVVEVANMNGTEDAFLDGVNFHNQDFDSRRDTLGDIRGRAQPPASYVSPSESGFATFASIDDVTAASGVPASIEEQASAEWDADSAWVIRTSSSYVARIPPQNSIVDWIITIDPAGELPNAVVIEVPADAEFIVDEIEPALAELIADPEVGRHVSSFSNSHGAVFIGFTGPDALGLWLAIELGIRDLGLPDGSTVTKRFGPYGSPGERDLLSNL